MTRANARSWVKLVAGLVVGAASAPLFTTVVPFAVSGSALIAAPLPERPLAVHEALNNAIDCHRRGDYEGAEELFKYVDQRRDELTEPEKVEAYRFWHENAVDLEARHEGTRQLHLIDKALLENRIGDANELLKKVQAKEQFLTPGDKTKFRELYAQINGKPIELPRPSELPKPIPVVLPPAASVKPGPAATVTPDAGSPVANASAKPSLADARAKLQQARAQLNEYNLDLAEREAHETERLGVSFPPAEDSPAKLLHDINKARGDAKTLLMAARAAMGRQEFEVAEKYAKQADGISGTFTFTLSSDSPSKVLKELKEMKEVQAVKTAAPPVPPPVTVAQTTSSNKPAVAPQPVVDTQTDKARLLLRQGRKALEENKLALAKQLAEQAKVFKPVLETWEETPETLLADIARAEAKAVPQKPAEKKLPKTKEEAVALVKLAREQLAEGKIEEAQDSALKARAVKNASWGLLDDSPESALKDIEKARVRRDQAEAAKVLVAGRKLLDQGDWEGAQRAAYRAQKLHGPYSMLDFGDRPDRLLADAQALRNKPHKPDTTAVAKKDDKNPEMPAPTPKPAQPIQTVSNQTTVTTPPLPPKDYSVNATLPPVPVPQVEPTPRQVPVPNLSPVNLEAVAHSQAMQRLAEARRLLKTGDIAGAKSLADQVSLMKVTYNIGEDCPALLYEDIVRQSQQPVSLQPAPVGDAVKAKAKQLLAEARQFQKGGQYIEARQKCLEATQTGAKFDPDEDDPAPAYQQIAIMAKQHVDALGAEATEVAHYGNGEPMARYQKAEQLLQEALKVAKYFGFDTASLEAKMTWLQEVRAQALGKAPPVVDPRVQQAKADPVVDLTVQQAKIVPPQPATSMTGAQKGRQLLDQARNELRAGALAQARINATEAMKDEYGVAEEAAAVLRTIDTEDFNQKCLDERHAFDAAEASCRVGDYAHATVLLGAIDPRNLDEPRKARLRELSQTPGMMAVRQDTVAKVGPNDFVDSTPGTGGLAAPGRASASDQQPASPEKDLLKDQVTMRNVLFQKLRSDGLEAQSDAMRKASAGDYDQALEVLNNYLEGLTRVTNLDPSQLAHLRNPVESRRHSLELMKVQGEIHSQDKLASTRSKDVHDKRLLAEETKQKKISDLMKQCSALVKDNKLDEAYRLALVVKQMDPDNAAVEAMVLTVEFKNNLDKSNRLKKERENYFLDSMNDTDVTGPYLDHKNPIQFDAERSINARKRPDLNQMIQRKTKDMLQMESKLMTPVTINFKDVPMRQAIDDLRSTYALNFNIDDASLTTQGISLDRTVSLRLDGVALKTALDCLLPKLNLSYVIHDKYLDITTKENAKGHLVRYTYQVTDLIVPVENSSLAPASPVLPGQTNTSSGLNAISTTGSPPVPLSATNGYSMSSTSGTPVGTPMGGQAPPPNDDHPIVGQYGHTLHNKKVMQTREDALIQLIKNTIEPTSWADAGGQGTIDYFPMAGALVINETLDIQEQVADLLQALRRLQDQEVAIEVRLITVDEDYYERIGLDFSMDIATNSRNAKYEPSLLTNAFAPGNQFNTAATGAAKGLLGGLTPAGTLTPDLSIPITPNSFTPAAPTFGGYQGPGVGGLTVGLAFLSDIQVSMLLEAVAGDARSSISQSPRLTLQNGQQATMSVIENLENLVTGVTLTQLPNGAFALVPQVQPINNEVDLQLSAVITADRRFVRLSPQLNLTNVSISNPAPAPTPILLPIYPNLNTTDPGNAVVYTQYLQQPQRISTINITTTVTVPDGGTVVMGGLKRMSEGRLEYGPPVLSKIPYINRLFRNVGYGRTGTSILIMVTPRIIIQEEEEERATGFVIRQSVVE